MLYYPLQQGKQTCINILMSQCSEIQASPVFDVAMFRNSSQYNIRCRNVQKFQPVQYSMSQFSEFPANTVFDVAMFKNPSQSSIRCRNYQKFQPVQYWMSQFSGSKFTLSSLDPCLLCPPLLIFPISDPCFLVISLLAQAT